MTLIALQSIAKIFGGRRLLHDLSWSVEDGVRVGLVGANGAGKSTILRILAGVEGVDAGEVVRQRGLRHAFLPQHVAGGEASALAVARSSRPDLEAVEQRLAACEAGMSNPAVYSDATRMERALAEQERLLRQFEELGGAGL